MNKLRSFFLWCFPLGYIIYVIYIRLNPKPPRDLSVLLTLPQTIITITIFIVTCFRIYSLLKTVEIIENKKTTNKFFLLILKPVKVLSTFFTNMWIEFFRLLLDKYFKLNLYMVKFIHHLYTFMSPKGFYTILFADILPRILVVSIFIIEIIFFHRLYYFYISLIILLLPLCVKLVDKIILQFYEDNYPCVKDALDITEKPNPNPAEENIFTYKFAAGFIQPDFIKDLEDFLENHYAPLRDIPNLINCFKFMRNKFYYNYIDLFIALTYLLGWGIIIYVGFLKTYF